MTAVAISFTRVLPNWMKASSPNIRVSPVIGFSLLKSGASLLGTNIRPVCSTLPATPRTMVTPRIMIRMGSTAMPRSRAMVRPPSPLSEPMNSSGWAMNGKRSPTRLWQISGPFSTIRAQAPTSVRVFGSSVDLGTLPSSRACWSLRAEGSSVLSPPDSDSSAMAEVSCFLLGVQTPRRLYAPPGAARGRACRCLWHRKSSLLAVQTPRGLTRHEARRPLGLAELKAIRKLWIKTQGHPHLHRLRMKTDIMSW